MEKGIFVELVTGNIIMCMTGIGTTQGHISRLIGALRDIAGSREPAADDKDGLDYSSILTARLVKVPAPEEKISIPLKDAAGRVCAASIIPYPPGIPLACPGEILTEEVTVYIAKLRSMGEKVIGVSENGEILVGK